MAINSAAKRASAAGESMPWNGDLIPDGTISVNDRIWVLWEYSGNAVQIIKALVYRFRLLTDRYSVLILNDQYMSRLLETDYKFKALAGRYNFRRLKDKSKLVIGNE